MLFIFILLVSGVVAKHEEYKGYRVYNVEFLFQDQEDNFDRLKNDLIDFWKKPSLKYGVIGKAMVPPSHFDWFEEKLKEMEVRRHVFIEDVYEFLNTNAEESTRNSGIAAREFNFDAFHRYDVILEHLYALQNAYASSTTDFEIVQYGITAENRPLVYVKITNKNDEDSENNSSESNGNDSEENNNSSENGNGANESESEEIDNNNTSENNTGENVSEETDNNISENNGSGTDSNTSGNNNGETDNNTNENDGNNSSENTSNEAVNNFNKAKRNSRNGNIDKKVVIIEAGTNPREWITVPSALNVVNRVLEGDQRLLDEIVWIIIPVLNPDGYEYTHTNLRLWSKSMSVNSHLGFICPGVNLNRNFDVNWLISDSSTSPCSHLYAGVDPFSEVETQMIRYLLEEFNPTLYITLQNSGKFLTYPWAFEKAATGLFRRHFLLGLDMLDVLEGYSLDSRAVALGDRESGTSTDYARFSAKSLYTFNIGIEGAGEDGVIVAEDNIKVLVEDVWKAVAAAANGVIN